MELTELDFGCQSQLLFKTFTSCLPLAVITISTLSGKDSADRLMRPLFPSTLCPKQMNKGTGADAGTACHCLLDIRSTRGPALIIPAFPISPCQLLGLGIPDTTCRSNVPCDHSHGQQHVVGHPPFHPHPCCASTQLLPPACWDGETFTRCPSLTPC